MITYIFCRVLDDLRVYISLSSATNKHITPFTQIKQFWFVAGNAARNERSRVQLMWSPCKTKFEYSRPGIVSAPISISNLRSLVHENQRILVSTFQSLLPSTVSTSTIESLPWATMTDEATSDASFLDNGDYWNKWMKTAVVSLVEAYLDPTESNHRLLVDGRPSLSAMQQLLQKDFLFQQSLILEMVTDTGISPRAVAMREFRYRTDSLEKRNLHLFNGHVVLYGGRQKGESRRNGHRELVVRAFCWRVGRIILQYLALIRRAIIEILKIQGWYHDIIATFSTHLLVDFTQSGNSDGCLEVAEITRTWQEASQPVLHAKLSIVDMRQIGTGIFVQLFPDLIRLPPTTSSTAVDGLGDHGRAVNDNHYGRSSEACGGVSQLDIRDYILASNVQQALMHTHPVDALWPGSIRCSPVLDCDRFQKTAFDYAHYAIPDRYKFHDLRREVVQELVRKLCKDLAAMFGGTVSLHWKDFWISENESMSLRVS